MLKSTRGGTRGESRGRRRSWPRWRSEGEEGRDVGFACFSYSFAVSPGGSSLDWSCCKALLKRSPSLLSREIGLRKSIAHVRHVLSFAQLLFLLHTTKTMSTEQQSSLRELPARLYNHLSTLLGGSPPHPEGYVPIPTYGSTNGAQTLPSDGTKIEPKVPSPPLSSAQLTPATRSGSRRSERFSTGFGSRSSSRVLRSPCSMRLGRGIGWPRGWGCRIAGLRWGCWGTRGRCRRGGGRGSCRGFRGIMVSSLPC